MSSEDRLAELERKVQYLTDRQEIYDCLVRTSRGNDRFDEALIVGSYHPDGLHELGENFIPGPHYGAYANDGHAAICDVNMHTVCMHSCEIDGDLAHAESYVIGLFADKGAETSRMIAGRYLDRLEKRGGEWKIVLRRTTVEVVMEGMARLPNGQTPSGSGYLKGSRDRSDPSYRRPLTPDGGERW
jgi:hypothetical protein